MYEEMKTVSELIELLRKNNYSSDFVIKNNKISSKSTGEMFEPEDVIIEVTYRYEGESDPSESAVVFAIRAKSGTKGILIDSYGAYSDPELANIIADIPVREIHDSEGN